MYHDAKFAPKSADIWDVERYESRHSYVWEYGSSLIDLLKPEPGERILDVGCGTARLTAQIAASGATVVGLDSDPGMIAQARINFPQLRFHLASAVDFALPEPVDAVFSNAALHWIREPEPAISRIAKALRPGGRFVAEFGGKGNVQAVVDAMAEAIPGARSPWYFPSVGEYAPLLERHGLEVGYARLFDRPTPLEGEDGMRDWLGMFGGSFFDDVGTQDRESLLRAVEALLRPKLHRDGRWVVDYKRLRIVAIRQP
ncbi:MAG: methyltransferase domain-containing protein [Acidobacteriota bacterium]|nr:methyltransferase domain-containing protein [Acidobacteriota bacterium]